MLNEREHLILLDHETVDLAKRGVSDWSDVATVTIAGDTIAPAAPTSISATQITEGIKVEWTCPTLNADGTTCTDLRWVKLYYKSTTGVSKTSNDGSYVLTGHVGDDQSFTDRIAAKTTRYYVLTALDKSGNESVESSEVSATSGNIYATPDVPDNATGHVFDDSQGTGGVILGDGIIGIVFQTPTWKSFDHYRLWYQYTDDGGTTWYDKDGTAGAWTEVTPVSRFGYVHKGLNTTYGYRYKATVVAKDSTESSTADTAGGASTIPNAADNSNIIGVLILAENLVATDEVRGEHIYAGSTIILDSAGYLKSSNYAAGSAGFKINGAGDAEFNDVTVRGELHAATGSSIDGSYLVDLSVGTAKLADLSVTNAKIANATIESAKIVSLVADKITGGTITAQTIELATDATPTLAILKSSNYTAGSTGWQIDSDGNAEFNDVTVRGELHAGTGSVIDGAYLTDATVTSGKLSVSQLSAISADLGTVTAGSIVSATYKTSSSYPYVSMNETGYTDQLVTVNSSGTVTFKLNTNGNLDANDIYVGGELSVNGAATGIVKAPPTNVFSGTAPTVWTDLDLSSYVGSRVALVLLRAYNNGATSENIRTRKNGSGWTSNDAVDSYPQVFGTRVVNGGNGFLFAITDGTGIIEWDSDQANSTDLYLVAYIN